MTTKAEKNYAVPNWYITFFLSDMLLEWNIRSKSKGYCIGGQSGKMTSLTYYQYDHKSRKIMLFPMVYNFCNQICFSGEKHPSKNEEYCTGGHSGTSLDCAVCYCFPELIRTILSRVHVFLSNHFLESCHWRTVFVHCMPLKSSESVPSILSPQRWKEWTTGTSDFRFE